MNETDKGTEVRVRANRLSVGGLVPHGRSFDASGLAAARVVKFVQTLQCAFRQSKLVVEDGHECHVDVDRFLDKRFDSGLHSIVDGRGVRPVDRFWITKSIIFGYVDEFYSVELTCLVDRVRTGSFIPRNP